MPLYPSYRKRHLTARRIARWVVGMIALGGCLVVGEAVIRARLPGSRAGGVTMYARPVVLYPGARIPVPSLRGYLTRQGYTETRRYRPDIGQYRLERSRWLIGRRGFRQGAWIEDDEVVEVALDYAGRIRAVRDRQGRRLRQVTLEPERLAVRGADAIERILVSLEDLPPHLVDAVLAVEDQRFFSHHGVDLRRIVGAMIANLRAGRVVQGGSTITQQLAKNLFLHPRRTVLRKVRELAMAALLELRYDKRTLLESYLNQLYLGQVEGRAVRGVGAAAAVFFDTEAERLTVAESALLAGIIRGPNRYSPIRHPERARERRALALSVMVDQGGIDRAESERAAESRLVRPRVVRPVGFDGRYFVDFALRRLEAAEGARGLESGARVYTTLHPDLQTAAEEAVERGLREVARGPAGEAPQAAMVVLDPRTGEVLAMVGGRDYGRTQFNRAVDARRQPGSAFKPVVTLAALSADEGFTLATRLPDEPLSVETPAGLWEPVNYDERFRGTVTLREALERSLNVPFARLGLAIGPERIAATGKRMGIRSPLHAVPSLALGASEVSPLELTRAFGVLASGGYLAPLNTVVAVIDEEGELISQIDRDGDRVHDAAVSYLVTSALEGVVERGTGRALRSMGVRGPVAGKSGTTNDYRDAWFVAFTPDIVVGVWVGHDGGESVGASGARAALPIVARFLRAPAVPSTDGFDRPRGIEVVRIEPVSGRRAGPGCRGEREVFLRGTAPAERCGWWARSARRWSSGGREGAIDH